MEREYLIKKWLDNQLTSNELEAFKQLEDYNELIKLSDTLADFKVEDFNTEAELQRLTQRIDNKETKPKNRLNRLLRIAAILIVGFGAYYFAMTLDTHVNTMVAQKESINLPDDSYVMVNALSEVTYNKRRWNKNRELILDGEAYFEVKKGSKFNVKTSAGTVSVLGTKFNVKNRPDYFKVTCFEGSVSVKHLTDLVVLKAGDSFSIINGVSILNKTKTTRAPLWITNESHFNSTPFKYIISEFERQYDVTFKLENIDVNKKFTGGFSHKNITLALQSITKPLNLSFTKTNKTIVLKRE